MRKILFTFILFVMSHVANADVPFAVSFQSIAIQDALHILAKQIHQDIIISPAVSGNIGLDMHNMTPREAFDFVLNSHGLTRFKQDNVWFIMPQAEFMQKKQDEWKLHELVVATAPLVTRIWQIRYAKAADVAHLIQHDGHSLLSKRGDLHVDIRTNQICIQDIAETIFVINKLVRNVDIPVKQVLIEARLASVDNDFEQQLGINFSVQAPDNLDRAKHLYSLVVAQLPDTSLLDVRLAALENTGHAELISSPSLFTADQQPASIESGEEIPYQEISRSGATGVAFKKAVLSLKVIPHVLPGNKVLLQLQVNQDRPSSRMVLGVPAITTRQIITRVLIPSGQTVVLGGIFESNKGDVSQKIPWVSHLPIVGLLFQQHDKVENKRELLIFVTPKVINPEPI